MPPLKPGEVADSARYSAPRPRWADRLEATGAVGVVRCHQYNAKVGAPLSCATTPRPASADEALATSITVPIVMGRAASLGRQLSDGGEKVRLCRASLPAWRARRCADPARRRSALAAFQVAWMAHAEVAALSRRVAPPSWEVAGG